MQREEPHLKNTCFIIKADLKANAIKDASKAGVSSKADVSVCKADADREKHKPNELNHCKYDFMNHHIYTISLPVLARCTSFKKAFMIFLFARSSCSIFLYSSLQMVWYSVCMRSLVSHPGCAFIQS